MVHSYKALPIGKTRLAAVINAASDFVRIEDAVQALGVPRTQAAKLLSRWVSQGWMRRVGKGTYVPVQLDLLNAETVVQDSWILVPALFSPAYIAGRTAAEHWDLTEQMFRDIVVCTTRPVREKTIERQSAVFTLKHIRKDLIFGIKSVWRGQTKVAVSDIHRTIVDILDDPALGGGIQHVGDCFERYLHRPDLDADRLIGYAERIGNGAIFKRLGFLAERHPLGGALVQASRDRLTQGHAKLDPALQCVRLVTRWRLRVPETWVK
jgi:predicted transcriptional regulator of viral defense system